MGLLDGKVALITGASKGIGKAIAERFAQEGAKVAFTYLSSVERGQALEVELSQYGEAAGFRSDASSGEQAEKLIEDVVAGWLIGLCSAWLAERTLGPKLNTHGTT